MQQHAKTVHCHQTCFFGLFQKGRLERYINNIGGNRLSRRFAKIEREYLLLVMTAHAKRCRVDDQSGVGDQFLRRIPAIRRDTWSEMGCEILRPTHRAIDDGDFLKAARQQRVDDCPACATSAQNKGTVGIIPAGSRCIEIGGKTIGISIAAMEPAIFKPKRVDRADSLRGLIQTFHRSIGCFLVGNGDIATGKTVFGKRRSKEAEILRLHFYRLIRTVDPKFIKPETMDQRRPRMFYRKAGDKRLLSHRSVFPSAVQPAAAAAADRQS